MKRSLALLLIALWSGQVLAQTDYPNRPVRVIAPFPPGQGTELIARAVAAQLTVQMGQNFFVENRPGAAGIIGTEAVKNAAPDGYTLLVAGGGPFAINMAMYAKLPYDTLRDFQPIGMIAAVPNVLVVSNDFPATSVKELLAHAAKQGEKLNYASSGVGVPNHLIMEMLKSAAGLRMTHVPYKGAAASIAALISGEIGLMFETPGAIVPHIRSGRVRALAVSSVQRSVALPDLPTIAEAGGPKGFGAQGWSALAAPAATPTAVEQKLYSELKTALARPDMKKRLLDIGVDPLDFTFEQTAAYFRSEVENWAKAVKSAGIKPE